ncbi:MAG: polysaccharide pyruvyl transferase family protein, partial [Deltaproteobacteria bacterium]|nr:polysaccharide pyruvyl transferase family protein [Deltaproteobacteria bacterium]
CIHDYHASPSKESLEEAGEEARFRASFSVKRALEDSKKVPSAIPAGLDWSRFAAPLIVGWYGTETAGDKAILGNIVKKLLAANKNSRITVASLYPFVTRRTLRELGVDAAIVKTFSAEYLQACESADAVIMGGGPLMGMEPLGFVLEAFLTARRFDIPAIVEGCGIGPLSEKAHISAVKEILRLSASIKVRDTASLAWVVENTARIDAVCSGDPAVDFVERWKKETPPGPAASKEKYLACFLREITTEYANGMGPDDFAGFKKNFEDELGKMVLYLREKTGLKPLFMPMHTFVIGNDDRDFMRRFVKTYFKDHEYELGDKVYSPQDILSAMSGSGFNLCMRFHSVLFADTLGVPFVAIDYTGGGKIKGYLKDRQREELKIDRADLAEGRWRKAVDSALLPEGF